MEMNIYQIISKILLFKSLWQGIAAFLLSILSFFAPLQLMYHTFFAAVMLDMITGILAAKKRGEKVESRKLRKTILKLLVYISAVSIFYAFQVAVLSAAVPIINVVFGLIILAEMKSMSENIDTMFDTSLFKTIYGKISNVFENLTKKKD